MEQSWNIRSSHRDMEASTLARRPLGGSLMIFTPFCKMSGGKCSVGIDDNQRRKSSCTPSGVSCSQMHSRSGSQETQRWQLQRSTQPPDSTAFWMVFAARGPWPWPREMLSSLWPILRDSAKAIISPTGSLPGDKMNTNGDNFVESSKEVAMSNAGGSTNPGPSSSATSRAAAAVSRSGRNARRTHIRCMSLSWSHGLGKGAMSASPES
mmetsp:Transcript_48022/g.138291  ORF Transcript_48022/g.138291 Transcript_48022/m.138291 type:complete len:209 (+) Transcript_48022:635-1261(+)